MITQIKRNLAKMGIGNPINRLFYTNREINEMKKRGEFFKGKINCRSENYILGYTNGYSAGRRKAMINK